MSTTIEILQAYPLGALPVKILDTCETKGIRGMVGQLFGLITLDADPEEGTPFRAFACLRFKDTASARVPVADVLPILRPFSALCDPLPDNTVPAVEVARIILSTQHDAASHRYDEARIRPKESKSGIKWVEVTVPGPNDNLEVAIYSTFDLENEDRGMDMLGTLEVLAYLRRNHFAVGLTPDQFIVKTA